MKILGEESRPAMYQTLVSWVLIVSSVIICCGDPVGEICDSPQYIELGKTDTIICNFGQDFFAVLWYTESDFENGTPAIHYQNPVKTGTGYESGEFDVLSSGSLIIYEVLLKHDTVFTVAYTLSDGDFYDFIKIRAIVVVKPAVPYPLMDLCDDANKCYAHVEVPTMECSVHGVRPNISLSLMSRTVKGDKGIPSDRVIVPDGTGYISQVLTKNIFHYSPLLVLLVCEASDPPEILKMNESMVLVERSNVDITQVKTIHMNLKADEVIKLNCTNNMIGFAVWKKLRSANYAESELLLYAVFLNGGFRTMFAEDIILEDNATLVIDSAKIKHEGVYCCVFGDGLNDGFTVFNVTVSVPAYPQIEGCNHQQYCVLEVEHEGTLKCTVRGIYPLVQLRLKTVFDADKAVITFTNLQTTATENGETFDVTLVAEYSVKDTSYEKLTVECKVADSRLDYSGLEMKADLLFEKGDVHTTGLSFTSLSLIILAVVAACLVLLACGAFIQRYVCKKRVSTTNPDNVEEMTSMMQGTHTADMFAETKQQFLKELREKYKDLYDAVQPIPYIKDRLYCVDRVFVEGGIVYLASGSAGKTKEQWASLESYRNVFDDSKVSSTRRILEGEPGYGKSTVTLQFAYDWCNSVPASVLRNVEILILLRLRQLGGVSSIYRAIKQFILPKDSRLSESDIETILQDSNSVVIILDGFDEYPDQDSSTSDVISIIARQMFQNFEVVLTTRSSFLPQTYPPLTKRLRLIGFDDNARRYYIRKAVVGNDDDESVKRIEGYLEENPILSDLCQVPLLFVIFAHMTYESEEFRKLNSVTSFFRYMISCFHSHMRNKMNEENVNKYELFETDHGVLNKVAFEAFSGNSQRIVWKKDELCEQLGREFYDQYIRIGILVEEEVIDITDDPSTPITEHVQYKTEVRFYHKLFCEWYAAHYLSNYIQQNPNLDLTAFLQNLDPFDVQYLYRFACGLNSNSAEKIIGYLKGIEGGDKFAILCILEQTGKIDNIMETISQLCSEGIIISGHDSQLLQRSSFQLLEIAARNDILVEYAQLYNCLQSVDLSTAAIRTTSGLALTSRIPIKQLVIWLNNRKTTEDEYIAILQFSSMCQALRILGFGGSAPPRSFTVEPLLSSLGSRNVRVVYFGAIAESSVDTLNLQTGRWERKDDGTECTDEDFERMNLDWAKVPDNTEEYHKSEVQDFRELLRQKTEKKQNEGSNEANEGEHHDDEDDNN